MPAKRKLRKIVDEESEVRCTSGAGLIREEVWLNDAGEIVRYNLAFINHFLNRSDHGRVLGYDNRHGHHHRHFMGQSETSNFSDYIALRDVFVDEVRQLRRKIA